MNLGQHIVDSVVEAGAIESLIKDRDGGSKIFVWSSNANEQVEAAFLNRMRKECLDFSTDKDNIEGLRSCLLDGAMLDPNPDRVMTICIMRIISNFLFAKK